MTNPMKRCAGSNIRHQGALGVDREGKVVLCDGMVNSAEVRDGLLRIEMGDQIYIKNMNFIINIMEFVLIFPFFHRFWLGFGFFDSTKQNNDPKMKNWMKQIKK